MTDHPQFELRRRPSGRPLLLAGLTGLLVVIGALIGGPQTALLFLGIALVMNLGVYWFSDKIALKSAGAKPITEERGPADLRDGPRADHRARRCRCRAST